MVHMWDTHMHACEREGTPRLSVKYLRAQFAQRRPAYAYTQA